MTHRSIKQAPPNLKGETLRAPHFRQSINSFARAFACWYCSNPQANPPNQQLPYNDITVIALFNSIWVIIDGHFLSNTIDGQAQRPFNQPQLNGIESLRDSDNGMDYHTVTLRCDHGCWPP